MSKTINRELKNIVEAALLVAGQPLTLERLAALFPVDSQPSREELHAVLARIEDDCAERGVELKQIGKGWRLQTKGKYAEYVAKLLEERPLRYSRALLETLAIIAYRQPVTRGEIEDIRGVAVSTDIIRTLVERGWIKQVGVREVPGRPALYGTTPVFLEHFNLKNLQDMPPLAELRSIEDISADLDQRVAAHAVPAQPGAPGDGHASDRASETATETTADVRGEEATTEVSMDDMPSPATPIAEPETMPSIEAQAPDNH